jgi:hypothetical protein
MLSKHISLVQLHFSVISKINYSIGKTRSTEKIQKFYGSKGRIFHDFPCVAQKNQANQSKQNPTEKCNRPELNRAIFRVQNQNYYSPIHKTLTNNFNRLGNNGVEIEEIMHVIFHVIVSG